MTERHPGTDGDSQADGRLATRPARPSALGPTGLRALGLGSRRDGLFYAPPRCRGGQPVPLVVMLHGPNGNAGNALAPLRSLADRASLVLLAPESRGPTWDVLRGGFGPDVAFIDQALDRTFRTYRIDPGCIAIAGFSDGASYALSLGVTNGDLFSDIIAFSPGFSAPGAPHGSPRIFISHGIWDSALPIADCSRRIAPALERAGYDVHYREFRGFHTIPPGIAREAVRWLTR